jgi:hypothetical protein
MLLKLTFTEINKTDNYILKFKIWFNIHLSTVKNLREINNKVLYDDLFSNY